MRKRSRPYLVSASGVRPRRFRDIGAATRYAKELATERGESSIAFVAYVGGWPREWTMYTFRRDDDGTIHVAASAVRNQTVEEGR